MTASLHDRLHAIVCHPVHATADALHGFATRFVALKKHHSRFFVGLFFMVAGSSLAVSGGALVSSHAAHVALDLIAYAVHGMGAVPFVNVGIRMLALE